MPAIPLTMTAGAIFGVIPGTMVVSVAGTMACTISFLIARYVARDKVRLAACFSFLFLERRPGPVLSSTGKQRETTAPQLECLLGTQPPMLCLFFVPSRPCRSSILKSRTPGLLPLTALLGAIRLR